MKHICILRAYIFVIQRDPGNDSTVVMTGISRVYLPDTPSIYLYCMDFKIADTCVPTGHKLSNRYHTSFPSSYNRQKPLQSGRASNCPRRHTSFSSKVCSYNRQKQLQSGRASNCPRRSRGYMCCSSVLNRLLTVVRLR